jgi:hypothetical protein
MEEARQPGEDIASYLNRNSTRNDHGVGKAAMRGYCIIFELEFNKKQPLEEASCQERI